MAQYGDVERFAAWLRMLRERAGHSYEALARKTGISRSSLHRYCAGTSVPPDYGVAHRIATVCGATSAELRELHRLWALADAERGPRPAPEEGRQPQPEERPRPSPETPETPEATSAEAGEEPAHGVAETHGATKADGTSEAARTSEAAGTPEVPVFTVGRPENPDAPDAPETPDTPRQMGSPSPSERPTPREGKRFVRGRRLTVVTAVAAVIVLAVVAWRVSLGSSPAGSPEAADRRLLFSATCEPVVSMGQHDECVREAQLLLRRRGATIGVDGSFGPETLRRVTAFQVLEGISPNGVVADPTKKALYESKVRLDTWSPEKVRKRVREVFTEAPDDAVAIADCQSFLDPLHILPNTNGTRNWGLFQISDARLRELRGTPRKALDPEWNIQAAKRLWDRERDFHDWPHCSRALRSAPTASASSTPR
ncbi:helix-turn-helix domain-containing protein [Streptomyces phyllanthi]|uniref:Helix-turn-helix domain-containing protein n=1 Tax=Streptomyces phyllanthi TaxID=1803180 RepID=A0A5N8W5D6_9ACTN|nr:helix-turn-helix domain-containing protein [Streptomyces phyllanthi]MPY42116.1 helix-turn-helix domain-containing protein [Streptomyces phyllanthi]